MIERDWIKPPKRSGSIAELRRIGMEVARKYNIAISDMFRSDKGSLYIAHARQEAYCEAQKTGASLTLIGMAFNRHHTTILEGIRKYKERNAGK